MFTQAVVDEATNEQVEPSIIVVVEPNCARRPPRGGNTGLGGNIGKGPVAVIVIQQSAAISRDEQVRKAVVVIIANRDTHSESSAWYSSPIRNISKGTVTIVFVQGIL